MRACALMGLATAVVVLIPACDTGKSPNQPSAQANPLASSSPGQPPANVAATPAPVTADTSQRATVHGMIYTHLGDPVDGAAVTGRIMGTGRFTSGSNTLVVTSKFGAYAFNGTPTGETLVITVSKSGLKTQEQTIVPLANLTGNSQANRVDFGGSDPTYAL